MIVQLIENIYQFLWGEWIHVPLPGGGSLGLSLLIILLLPAGIVFTIKTRFLPIRLLPDIFKPLTANNKNEKDEKYPDNFLKEDDKFAADEERELWFDLNKKDETSDAEKTEDAKTEENAENTEEKEIPKYNIQLTFEDGTTSEIHTFPFGDTEEAELHLEGSVAYLVFDSASQKKSINTLENEKALAPTPTAAPVAQPATESYDNSYDYNESYDYDNSYDYDDNSYDAAGSDDSGSDEGGSADGCLDNAILN